MRHRVRLKIEAEIGEIFDAVIDRIKEKKFVTRWGSLLTKRYKQDAAAKFFGEIKDEARGKIERKKNDYREIVEGAVLAMFEDAENKYKAICEEIKLQKCESLKGEKAGLANALNSYKNLKNIIDAR